MKASASLLALVFAPSIAIATPQPDFTLPDVNPNSIRSGEMISPRDYRQQITVYYFGREW